ncbi:hypothetical protein [Aeoliella sp. SH292]|uniref:hypothetical protein n=1 Tax=Aeoliella sp. SH292 TaxID=3454464 RepID=UPI003F9C4628
MFDVTSKVSVVYATAVIVVSLSGLAIGQTAPPVPFELEFQVELITPQPTSFEDTLVRARISNLGVGVQSTFDPYFMVDGSSILIDFGLTPPAPGQGPELPATQIPDAVINLGRLTAGTYDVTVRWPGLTEDSYFSSEPLSFTVVPEPTSVGVMLLSSMLGIALYRRFAGKHS